MTFNAINTCKDAGNYNNVMHFAKSVINWKQNAKENAIDTRTKVINNRLMLLFN